jgi:hypothetical protein
LSSATKRFKTFANKLFTFLVGQNEGFRWTVYCPASWHCES